MKETMVKDIIEADLIIPIKTMQEMKRPQLKSIIHQEAEQTLLWDDNHRVRQINFQ